jgi:hypothetical protein
MKLSYCELLAFHLLHYNTARVTKSLLNKESSGIHRNEHQAPSQFLIVETDFPYTPATQALKLVCLPYGLYQLYQNSQLLLETTPSDYSHHDPSLMLLTIDFWVIPLH